MPFFPATCDLDNIITDSYATRWLFPERPIDVASSVRDMAQANGFRVEPQQLDDGDQLTLRFPVPSAAGRPPRIANADVLASYPVKLYDDELTVATVHDLGDAAAATVGRAIVQTLLDTEPRQAVAVEIPDQVSEGNLALYALAINLHESVGKVAVAGVDSNSRVEAKLAGPARFSSLPSGLRSYKAAFRRYQINQAEDEYVEQQVDQLEHNLQRLNRLQERATARIGENQALRVDFTRLAISGIERLRLNEQ